MEKNMKEKTCCFTGHRAIPARALPALAEELEQTLRRLIGEGMRYFGAGGALGFDTLAAETVLRLVMLGEERQAPPCAGGLSSI